MKTIATFAFAALAASAFAGQPVVNPGKNPVVPEPCFGETELQLDLYGAYSSSDGEHGDGFGGGLGLSYYFSRNFGFGVDGTVTSGDSSSAVWQVSGNILARYPVDLGGLCLAPYVKVGGGVQVNGSAEGFLGAGGGIEFRITPRVGLFGEGTYNWASDDNDFIQARAGVRFAF